MDSDNLGDEIIMDAVWDIVRPLFPGATFVRTPSHRYTRPSEWAAGRKAALSIVGGTNILKSHMLIRSNWRITPLDYLLWRNVVLLGVGWQQYSGEADMATRLFFSTILSKTGLQSVRDEHTRAKLGAIMPNVIYTACPTLWELDTERCKRISSHKARNAVFAVTYYRPDPEQDLRLYALLKKHYDKIFFWPQQSHDIPYLRDIGIHDIIPIAPQVSAYNRVLDEEDVDVVGSRLHGGIRALQRGRRALIIPVDNRAVEMGKTTAIPTEARENIAAIEHWILNPRATKITLPEDSILRWKAQFAG
jgi:polysaccharide pyruvyl transferase WcaK-like protein